MTDHLTITLTLLTIAVIIAVAKWADDVRRGK